MKQVQTLVLLTRLKRLNCNDGNDPTILFLKFMGFQSLKQTEIKYVLGLRLPWNFENVHFLTWAPLDQPKKEASQFFLFNIQSIFAFCLGIVH